MELNEGKPDVLNAMFSYLVTSDYEFHYGIDMAPSSDRYDDPHRPNKSYYQDMVFHSEVYAVAGITAARILPSLRTNIRQTSTTSLHSRRSQPPNSQKSLTFQSKTSSASVKRFLMNIAAYGTLSLVAS